MAVLLRLEGGAVVCEATPADRAALAELEAETFAEPWGEGSLGRALADPFGVVVKLENARGELIAYALLRAAAGEAELMRVATLPAERGKGYGRAVVEVACRLAAERGAAECFLEVRHDNASALAVYEHTGFVRCGLRKDYYGAGLDAVLMVRNLADYTRHNGSH